MNQPQLYICSLPPEPPLPSPSTSPSHPSAAAAKSLQSCPTLCSSIDGSPPGSPVPGILQAQAKLLFWKPAFLWCQLCITFGRILHFCWCYCGRENKIVQLVILSARKLALPLLPPPPPPRPFLILKGRLLCPGQTPSLALAPTVTPLENQFL